MENRNKKIIILASLAIFLLAIWSITMYLTSLAPVFQTAPLDLFSIVHAIAAAGLTFLLLELAPENKKAKRYVFFAFLALVFIWEIVENVLIKKDFLVNGSPFFGQESLANISADIIIGIIFSSMAFFYHEKIYITRRQSLR